MAYRELNVNLFPKSCTTCWCSNGDNCCLTNQDIDYFGVCEHHMNEEQYIEYQAIKNNAIPITYYPNTKMVRVAIMALLGEVDGFFIREEKDMPPQKARQHMAKELFNLAK